MDTKQEQWDAWKAQNPDADPAQVAAWSEGWELCDRSVYNAQNQESRWREGPRAALYYQRQQAKYAEQLQQHPVGTPEHFTIVRSLRLKANILQIFLADKVKMHEPVKRGLGYIPVIPVDTLAHPGAFLAGFMAAIATTQSLQARASRHEMETNTAANRVYDYARIYANWEK
jgi:hypothetical protein